jgi:hypothetical protein
MPNPEEMPTLQGNARRRLMRGAFAAPAVMTVWSGAALAASSSNLRCLTNQIAKPVFPGVTTAPDSSYPSYPRVQLAELRPNGANAVSTFYVNGATVATLKKSPSYTLTTGKWQVFYLASNTDVNGPILTDQPTGNGGSSSYIANSGKYAVLRFDANGDVVGVGAGPTGTSAVAASCWSSVRPVA